MKPWYRFILLVLLHVQWVYAEDPIGDLNRKCGWEFKVENLAAWELGCINFEIQTLTIDIAARQAELIRIEPTWKAWEAAFTTAEANYKLYEQCKDAVHDAVLESDSKLQNDMALRQILEKISKDTDFKNGLSLGDQIESLSCTPGIDKGLAESLLQISRAVRHVEATAGNAGIQFSELVKNYLDGQSNADGVRAVLHRIEDDLNAAKNDMDGRRENNTREFLELDSKKVFNQLTIQSEKEQIEFHRKEYAARIERLRAETHGMPCTFGNPPSPMSTCSPERIEWAKMVLSKH